MRTVVASGQGHREYEWQYKAYLLNYITQDIDDIIHSNPMTYEEFAKMKEGAKTYD